MCRLVLFGGRSWSIFKASDMSLVYDSGNDLERVMAGFFPWTFNTDKPEGFCAEAPPPSVEVDESLEDVSLVLGICINSLMCICFLQ